MYYNLSCKRESTLQRILDYDPLLIIYTPLIVARWFPHRATLFIVNTRNAYIVLLLLLFAALLALNSNQSSFVNVPEIYFRCTGPI